MKLPKGKFLSLLLIAGLCLCLTVSLSIYIYHTQQKELESRFEDHTQQILVSLRREVDFNAFQNKEMRIREMVERSLDFLTRKSINLYLYDELAAPAKKFLYAHQINSDNFKPVLQKKKYLHTANRVWSVVFVADPQYLAREISRDHWKIFGIGLLLTVLIILNLSQLILRSEEIEKQVVQRTRELTEANEDLMRFNRITVGRELRMIELKQEINALSQALGKEPPDEHKE